MTNTVKKDEDKSPAIHDGKIESAPSAGIDEGIPKEILEAIPEKDRGKLIAVFKESMFRSISRETHPLIEKISSEHITSLITNADDQDKRDRKERSQERVINFFILLVVLVFVSFLIIFLKENQDLLIPVITGILSFAGGFGVGKYYKKE